MPAISLRTGPEAYRPDDIITMHSGLTCEVDNTDAEGRFVVGDGCSYLAREPRNRSATWSAFACQPLREMVVWAGEMGVKTLIDSATLTGHSSFTGPTHCAIMSNCADMEATGIEAGLESGEHGFPMIFLPEAQKKILASPVADLINSAGGTGGMGSAVGG